MFCKCCGKDVLGTDECIYCGTHIGPSGSYAHSHEYGTDYEEYSSEDVSAPVPLSLGLAKPAPTVSKSIPVKTGLILLGIFVLCIFITFISDIVYDYFSHKYYMHTGNLEFSEYISIEASYYHASRICIRVISLATLLQDMAIGGCILIAVLVFTKKCDINWGETVPAPTEEKTGEAEDADNAGDIEDHKEVKSATKNLFAILGMILISVASVCCVVLYIVTHTFNYDGSYYTVSYTLFLDVVYFLANLLSKWSFGGGIVSCVLGLIRAREIDKKGKKLCIAALIIGAFLLSCIVTGIYNNRI